MSCLDEVRFPMLPAVPAGGEAHPAFEGNEGTVTYGFDGVDADGAEAYRTLLSENGLERVAENKIGDCTFATFVKDSLSVRVAHYPAKRLLKLVATCGEPYVTFDMRLNNNLLIARSSLLDTYGTPIQPIADGSVRIVVERVHAFQN